MCSTCTALPRVVEDGGSAVEPRVVRAVGSSSRFRFRFRFKLKAIFRFRLKAKVRFRFRFRFRLKAKVRFRFRLKEKVRFRFRFRLKAKVRFRLKAMYAHSQVSRVDVESRALSRSRVKLDVHPPPHRVDERRGVGLDAGELHAV